MVLDDNAKERFLLHSLLKRKMGFQVMEADFSSYKKLLNGNLPTPDALVVDMSSLEDPYNIIAQCKSCLPETPVIALVKFGEYQQAVHALQVGAYDYVTKPVAEERLLLSLRNAIEVCELRRAMKQVSIVAPPPFSHTVGTIIPEATISLINSNGEARTIGELEQEAIRFAIRFYDGRMTEAARKLGIGRSTLYRKLGTLEPA
jgi:DNA-binding NtrC family response regulator